MSGKLFTSVLTGANRGIGYGLAVAIAARENTVVFAAARDPTTQSLKDLSARYPNVHPIKFTCGDQFDNEAAIAEIKRTAGQLDVIIANAGISKHFSSLATTPLSEFREHWEVNTLGTVVLFQAAQTLLLASPTGAPVFAYISSAGGSIGKYFGNGMAAYGSSKAAANFLVKVLDEENPTLVAMAISPGWVPTDMGNLGAQAAGLAEAPDSLEEVVEGIMSRIDGATVEKSSGRFWNFKAKCGNPWDVETEEVPW
ncbi:hypothetical protein C8R43DRAFT_1087794 [Mycena crocata]|nr:hypothetical protein C8R43DRAFT_1087794 [Mycena crocata]